jgi:uncharacterized protein (UPF0332 family)
MNDEVCALWARALSDLAAAEALVNLAFHDAAASRAYYAAFSGVSALFLSEGHSFRKHSQIESAVHRDLVHGGRWDASLGADFSFLRSLRSTGDYGSVVRVSEKESRQAIAAALRILDAVRTADGILFPMPNP